MTRDDLQLLQDFTRKFMESDGEEQTEVVAQVTTDPSALSEIYKGLPSRFPVLFEKLLLSYRWRHAEVAGLRLLDNPPGRGLSGFLKAITADGCIYEVCTANGYLQFARGEDISYDPICFDFKKRVTQKVALVRLDHEEILCRERIRVKEIVATSFDQFVKDTVSIRSE